MIRNRYIGSHPVILNAPHRINARPGRTEIAWTLIALEDLSFAQGLPALGQPPNQISLRSGEAVHFWGDVWRTYHGKGGMIFLLQWNALESAKADAESKTAVATRDCGQISICRRR